MSNILKGIHLNEADPRNFDSDIDYYAARNAPAKARSHARQSPGVNPDDEDYFREIFRKKREAAKKAEQDKAQGVSEADAQVNGHDVDVNVVVGKLYDFIDHAEHTIKNADYDRQVQYATIIRDRAVKALEMIRDGGNTPEAADAAFRYMQTGNQGVAEGSSATWEVNYDYGPHMTKSVTVKAGSEEEARAKVEKAAEKKGLSIMINSVEPAQQGVAEEKQRLDPKCWSGYKKQGTKMKGDTRVNNCVPVEEGGFDTDSYYDARSSGEYGRNLTTAGERSAHYDGKGDGTGTRGRPVKDKLKKSNLPADPFGRTTGKIPASAKPKRELDPFRDIDESLEYSKRQQIIRFLAKKMDWEVSYLELASDANLISWYKKVQAGKDPMKESQKEADYGDDYQSMVSRVGQKAKDQDAKKSPEQRQADLERLAKRLNQPEKKSNILKGIEENLGTPYPSTYEEENKPFMKKGSYRITAMTSENKK